MGSNDVYFLFARKGLTLVIGDGVVRVFKAAVGKGGIGADEERGKRGEMIFVRKECMGNNLHEPPTFMPSPQDSTPLQPGYLPGNRRIPPRRHDSRRPFGISGIRSDRRYGSIISCLLRDSGLMFQELRRVDA